jgi:hemerythrin-like domain-containing protein
LGALQTYATRLRSGATLDPDDLTRFSEVFRDLIDYRHHEKEEGIFLPFLARHGFEWSSGLLAELHGEHGHLRYLIDVLCQVATSNAMSRDNVPGLARPNPSREQRRQIFEAASAFVEFKRRHIEKEETVLAPAILARLSPTALERLGAELEQFDVMAARNESAAAGNGAAIYRQAAELVQRYSVDSGTVDVSRLDWTPAPSSDSAARDSAARDSARVWPEGAVAGLTSFGRSR